MDNWKTFLKMVKVILDQIFTSKWEIWKTNKLDLGFIEPKQVKVRIADLINYELRNLVGRSDEIKRFF